MGAKKVSYKLQPGSSEIHNFPCKSCAAYTNHKVVASFDESGSELLGHYDSVDWNVQNQIVQCQGCNEVSFRTCSTNSENYDHDYDTGERIWLEDEKFFPPRVTGSISIDYLALPIRIGQIYKEAKYAVESELLIIAGIAIRAILDSICVEAKSKGNSLYEKIDDLHAQSLVTKEGVDILHKIRVLGNRSAHEAQSHNKDQLLLAMEVVEYILVGAYLLPERAKKTFKEIDNPRRLAAPESNLVKSAENTGGDK